MASPRTCTEMVERGDLEADIREVNEDEEETRGNGEIFSTCGDAAVVVMSEITPLLDSAIQAVQNPPQMNIFSVSYPRSRSKETVNKQVEADLSSLYQFMLWIWSGSKYSGFLCMVVSSVTYCIMELLLEVFPASRGYNLHTLYCSIPLLQSQHPFLLELSCRKSWPL